MHAKAFVTIMVHMLLHVLLTSQMEQHPEASAMLCEAYKEEILFWKREGYFGSPKLGAPLCCGD